MIKVRGGTYLHRNLKEPPAEITRPTKDMAKEGLFNSLGFIKGKSFLDLFSGSGAIGIEAYSRGASPVYLNDANNEPFKVIKENLENLKITDVELTKLDYLKAIELYSNKNIKFDYIFLDPPYKLVVDQEFIKLFEEKAIVHKDTVIIVETDYEIDSNLLEDYSIKVLKYGRSKMNILRRKPWE